MSVYRQPSTGNSPVSLFLVIFFSVFMAILLNLLIVRFYLRESAKDALSDVQKKFREIK